MNARSLNATSRFRYESVRQVEPGRIRISAWGRAREDLAMARNWRRRRLRTTALPSEVGSANPMRVGPSVNRTVAPSGPRRTRTPEVRRRAKEDRPVSRPGAPGTELTLSFTRRRFELGPWLGGLSKRHGHLRWTYEHGNHASWRDVGHWVEKYASRRSLGKQENVRTGRSQNLTTLADRTDRPVPRQEPRFSADAAQKLLSACDRHQQHRTRRA